MIKLDSDININSVKKWKYNWFTILKNTLQKKRLRLAMGCAELYYDQMI